MTFYLFPKKKVLQTFTQWQNKTNYGSFFYRIMRRNFDFNMVPKNKKNKKKTKKNKEKTKTKWNNNNY